MALQVSKEIARLMASGAGSGGEALDEVIPLVYGELRRTAHRYMRRERPGHSLQTSALINEAYLRLTDQREQHWQNRTHFYAIAAKMMRRILVDHARARRCAKRGSGAPQVSLGEGMAVSDSRTADVVALDDALKGLEAVDSRKIQMVEPRFVDGLSLEEAAEAQGISVATVEREWRAARAWLHREIMPGHKDGF